MVRACGGGRRQGYPTDSTFGRRRKLLEAVTGGDPEERKKFVAMADAKIAEQDRQWLLEVAVRQQSVSVRAW